MYCIILQQIRDDESLLLDLQSQSWRRKLPLPCVLGKYARVPGSLPDPECRLLRIHTSMHILFLLRVRIRPETDGRVVMAQCCRDRPDRPREIESRSTELLGGVRGVARVKLHVALARLL